MIDCDKEEQKQIVKEAIAEWLDSKYLQVGKWTAHGLVASVVHTVPEVVTRLQDRRRNAASVRSASAFQVPADSAVCRFEPAGGVAHCAG